MCFRSFPVAKSLWERGGEGVSRVSVKSFFCLTAPKNWLEEPFCAVFQNLFGSEKAYGQVGREYRHSPSKMFCVTVLKKLVGEPVRCH